MTKRGNVHRFVLEAKERPVSYSSVKLKPYDQTTGTYFQVYLSSEENRWNWKLFLASSPQGPAARSSRGYKRRQDAETSIRTAFRAMREVIQS